jgi:hypothetical protein
MKLSDVPPHITELSPPWFSHVHTRVHGQHSHIDDVKPLFHLDYYDGPLSGIVKCFDRHYYVKAVYPEDRKYWVAWELTPEQAEIELANHALFQQHVGTHTDYAIDDEGEVSRKVGATRPQEEWDLFYKAKKKRIDYKAIEATDFFGVLLNPFRSW